MPKKTNVINIFQMSSSFVRTGRGSPPVASDDGYPGMKAMASSSPLPSIPKGCTVSGGDTLQTGSGVPSFDAIVGGGGLPLGTILLVREDWPRSTVNHTSSLLKCVMAEGLQLGHYLLLVDGGGLEAEHGLLKSLPLPIIANKPEGMIKVEPGMGMEAKVEAADSSPSLIKTGERGEEKMTIAWRYKHLRKLDDDGTSPFGALRPGGMLRSSEVRTYDLSKRLSEETLRTNYGDLIKYINLMDHSGTTSDLSEMIVKSTIELMGKAQGKGSIVRIILRTLPSPLLMAPHPQSSWERCSAQLLYRLRRALAPYADRYLMVVSSPPPMLFPPASGVEDQTDAIVELQSFVGTPKEHVRSLSEYAGFLRIIKPLRKTGTLALQLPPSSDLAFKVRRRQLIFEPFHMPPDLGGEIAGGGEGDQGSLPTRRGGSPGFSCPTTGLDPSKLEF